MRRFYLGTHLPNWLEFSNIPLFVSRRTLVKRRTFPRAQTAWALDSGGFSELSMYGRWTLTPEQYVQETRLYQEEIGKLEWAAIQDWMCEPFILKKTGKTIAEHQTKTLDNYKTLLQLAPDLPWRPVLQGWEYDDYARHYEMYAREFEGVEFGIGSVCRRQATYEAEQIIQKLVDTYGLKLHGFGFKKTGLRYVALLLDSADSMAWSFEARYLGYAWCGSTTHINCANCWDYARDWFDRLGTAQPAAPAVRRAAVSPTYGRIRIIKSADS